MRSDLPDWKGYWAAVPVPFDQNGVINREHFADTIAYFLESGVHGLLINGSSGEWFSQSHSERHEVAELGVKTAAHRVPVIIGCTALQPAEVIELASHAHDNGADGVLISPPPYLRLSQDDVFAFYEFVTRAAAAPVMIYNIPRRTGTTIDTVTAARLAELGGIVALKNSAPDADFFPMLEAVGDRIRVFGGGLFSPQGIPEMIRGRGSGYIGGWELLGDKLPGAFEAAWRGDADRAGELAAQERALDAKLWDERKNPKFGRSFHGQLKAALQLLGVPAGVPRRPLLPLDSGPALEELASVLRDAGLSLTAC